MLKGERQVKKSAVLLLALVMAMSVLAGCAKKSNAPKPDEPKKAETTDTGKKDGASEDQKEAERFAGRTLNVVATSEKYKEIFDVFTKETGAQVAFLSMSSGEVLSRVEAEGKPMADLWFGGGLDAFLAAKDKGYLASYIPKEADAVGEQFKDPEGYWIAKGITVVGFLANNAILKEKGLDVPKTWEALADPKYKDEVIMSTPAVSGTMFAAVKGILDLYGDEKGWAYWEKLSQNIPFFGKRGKDPQEKTMAGEFAVGIIPADKSAFDAAKEHDLTVIYPEDGICWVPEGVAVFKGAPGEDMAKAFIDFMLRDDIQEAIARLDGKDGAQMVKSGIKGFDLGLDPSKLVKENLSEFGTKRDAILSKWKDITADKEEK